MADPTSVQTLLSWSFEPSVVLGTALAAVLYLRGWTILHARPRIGAGARVRWPHAAAFAGGLVCIVVALESPIDVFSQRLFSLHMLQHMLLLMVAPPLLLLGKPFPVLVLGLPHDLARAVTRWHARTGWAHALTRGLINPWVAWWLNTLVTIIWHIPLFYGVTLTNISIHLAEHVSFLFVALLFWWVVIQPLPGRVGLGPGHRLLFVGAAMIPQSALGMVFVGAGAPIYTFYVHQAHIWGISPLDDQGLAGTLMWFIGDVALIVAAIPLFFRLMDRVESRELANADALDPGIELRVS